MRWLSWMEKREGWGVRDFLLSKIILEFKKLLILRRVKCYFKNKKGVNIILI